MSSTLSFCRSLSSTAFRSTLSVIQSLTGKGGLRCYHLPSKKQNIPTSYDPSKPDSAQDKLLFTPGPLTTSYTVKHAMTSDKGSRDIAFMQVIVEVCDMLLDVAGVSKNDFTTIPIQGSGTFGVEGTLSSAVDRSKGVLIIANGAYGLRMGQIAKVHKIPHIIYEEPDDTQPNLNKIKSILEGEGKNFSHVAVVHSETTSGIVNKVEDIGKLVKSYGKGFIVDAMSSFGAIPVSFENIDFLVSSANKCIEGSPGFSFAIARKSALEKCKGNATTLSLDLYAQRAGLDANGQFRFTPPTHSLLAFRQALEELKLEGGVAARNKRYRDNQQVLQTGLAPLGYQLYLQSNNQGPIISSYHYPKDNNWDFNKFYNKLNDAGFVIYPGKVSKADCFRIGHIGRIFPSDTQALVNAIDQVSKEMKTAAYFPKK